VASATALFQQAMRAYVAGDYPRAERLCGALLKAEPRAHAALHLQGLIDNRRGKTQRAARTLRKAIALAPKEAAYHNNLGEVLRAAGDLPGAVAAYRRAIEVKPQYPQALSNLGIALMAMGDSQAAEQALDMAVALQPDLLNARFNLGVLHSALGDRPKAEAAYRELLVVDPSHTDAWLNLGHLREAGGELDEARRCYERAVQLDSESALAHFSLARMDRAQYRMGPALGHLRRAVELDPKLGAAWTDLGVLYSLSPGPEAVERAQGCFRRALDLDPRDVEALVGLAGASLALGDRQQALALARRAVRTRPDHAGAWAELARARPFEAADDPDLLAMERRWDATDLSDEQRAALGFALAKAYSELGDAARAFSRMEVANRVVRKGYDYRLEDSRLFMEGLRRVFSPGRLARARPLVRGSLTPVLIVGMPRSGTTLVEQILASHPEVYGGGELNHLNDLVRTRCNLRGPGMESPDDLACLEQMSDADFAALGQAYLARLRAHSPDSPFITDKLPHNYLYLGMARLGLPEARVIHCRRNPVDTCFSLFERSFLGHQPYAYDLRELGEYYRMYQALMAFWVPLLGDFVLELAYEDLVQDQEGQTRRLLAFLGLDLDPRCLIFERTRRSVQTASMLQVRQPIYRSSIGRWRPFASYLRPLLDALGAERS